MTMRPLPLFLRVYFIMMVLHEVVTPREVVRGYLYYVSDDTYCIKYFHLSFGFCTRTNPGAICLTNNIGHICLDGKQILDVFCHIGGLFMPRPRNDGVLHPIFIFVTT